MTDKRLDAPNQQVVRPDESAPWQEGEGGSAPEPAKTETKTETKTKTETTKTEPRKAKDDKAG